MRSIWKRSLAWLLVLTILMGNFSPVLLAQGQSSSNLTDFLTSVEIDADQDENGDYINDGDFNVKLTFAESENRQFAEDTLTYQLPANLDMTADETEFNIEIQDDQGSAIVTGNKFRVVDGILYVDINKQDPNYSRLAAMANVKFEIALKATCDHTVTEVKFEGKETKTFTFVSNANLTITKTGAYDKENDKVTYTVTVKSQGINENVVLEDQITGTALTFNKDVEGTSSVKGSLSLAPNYAAITNGFTVNLGNMDNGEEITLTYSALVDNQKITKKGTPEETKNIAKVTSTQVPDGKEASFDFNEKIDFHTITKKQENVKKDENGNWIVSWTVEINKDHKLDGQNVLIMDYISESSRPFTSFRGEGITITEITPDGITSAPKQVKWSDMTYLFKDDNGRIYGWNYRVVEPSNSKSAYKVEYEALVDMSGAFGSVVVINTALFGDHQSTNSVRLEGPGSDFAIKKSAQEVTTEAIKWKSTITVPGVGVPSLTFKDTLPNTLIGEIRYYDTLDENSPLIIDGLMEGESYTVEHEKVNGEVWRITIKFYQDLDNTVPGLKPTPNGQARDVTIELTSKVNQDWFAKSEETGFTEFQHHKNEIYTRAGTTDKWYAATATPKRLGLVKRLDGQEEREIGGQVYPVYSYYVEFVNLSVDAEPLIFNDIFETDYLKYVEGSARIYAGNKEEDVLEKTGTNVNVESTNDGIKVTVPSLPRDNNYKPYAINGVYYELIVKDKAALDALNQAAAENANGEVLLKNTVKYGDLEAKADPAVYSYYSYVDKEQTSAPTSANGYEAEFKIIINPFALDLDPNSDTINAQDILSDNLRIDTDSIEISPKIDTILTSFDPETNTLTFKDIPDETRVEISYKVRVLGKGQTPYDNKVTFGDFYKIVEKNVKIEATGGGSASNPSITIKKRDKDDVQKGLANVTFELYQMDDGVETPVKDKNNEQVSFTTGQNGDVLIQGDQQAYGWTLWADGRTYVLREKNALPGYEQNTTAISFALAEIPENQEQYLFIGDSITVTNERTKRDVEVKKEWVGPKKDSVEVQLKADGEVIDSVTLNDGNNWKHSFKDLFKYDETGTKEIVYTVAEVPVAGYTSEITGSANTGFTITNTNSETIDISGSKTWDDSNNQDGKRPASITINLLADGTKVDIKEVTGADNWAWTFTGKPKYEGSKEIVYTITEDAIDGYTSTIDGYNVTNKHTPEKVDIEGSKTWDDGNNQDGKRPASITINLLADGTKIDSKTVTEADGWKWKFANMPKFADGKEITYTISEDTVPNYTTTVDGYDVTNSYKPGKTSVQVTKAWEDANNQDGKRPESVIIKLLADKKDTGKTVELNAGNNWTGTFADLDVNKGGEGIIYTVEEVPVEGYSSETTGSAKSGYTVTNKYTPETVDIKGSKTWEDANDQDGKRPASITINLLADNIKVDSKTVTAADGWTWTFTGKPKFADGKEIVYTIEEVAVEGYSSEITGNATSGFTVANKHTPETVTIEGSKTWEDGNNQDGKRPESITINLWADGTKVDSKTVTADDGWKWKFDNMPKFADGTEITYTITEDTVTDYTTTVDGYDVTNSCKPGKISVQVTKAWDDANNQDGKRPESVTVELYADDEATGKTVELKADNKWTASFTDLDLNKAGKPIVYTVKEEAVDGYTSKVTGDAATGFMVTNKYTPETVDIEGSKTWDDGNNQDGKRPESITINLLADGTKVDSKTVTEDDGWAWSFTGKPKFANGSEIIYSISEEAVAGYSTNIAGYNVTNSYTPEKTSVKVTKVWDDADNQDGIRPPAVTVELFADGTTTGKTLELNKDNDWTVTFADLDLNKVGTAIVYTVKEKTVAGYTTEITGDAQSGYTVTNKHTPETMEIPVTKTWDDADNQDGKRPAAVTIKLLADDADTGKTLLLNEDNKWTDSFKDLAVNKAGTPIVYTIEEVAVEGYTCKTTGDAETGFTVTNKHTPETVDIEGSKIWDDADDQDGKRPTSITINLLANGDKVDSKEVTAVDGWKWSFTGKPKFAKGEEITYAIAEVTVTDYSTTVEGYNVKNSYTPDKTSVQVIKAWDDANNQDGKRPTSVTIELFADTVATGKTLELTEDNNWTASFTDLDVNKAGKPIVYTVKEKTVEGYTTQVTGDATTGFTVKNSYTPETVDIAGAKTWDDADNQDGKRPESITVNLLADGVKVDAKTVTAGDGWKWTFKDQPKFAKGNEIVYTISEEAVEGYTTKVDGFNISNSYTPETLDITGAKTWDDADNQDGKRPKTITVNLLADGVKVDSKTVSVGDNWKWTFKDQPKFANGKKINYTVTEEAIEGYTTTVDGFNVTNKHTPEKTSVQVTKAWKDCNNQDGKRPGSVTIKLFANNVDTNQTLTLSEVNHWTGTFENLDAYKDGHKIVYTVKEESLANGYKSVVTGNAIEGFVVTNSRTPEVTEVKGYKTWDDANNQDGKRPSEITIRLLANGTEKDSKVVKASDNWSWIFDNLPKYEAGKLITYTVSEDKVDGYTTVVKGYNVINSYTPGKTSVQVTKSWQDANNQDGVRPESVTIKLLADGKATGARLTLTAADNWTGSFTDLDEYKAGKKIVYTVEEKAVGQGYSTVIKGDSAKGFVVTNIRTPETVEVAGTKTWDDAKDKDGRRPREITIRLLANGVEKDSKVVRNTDGWKWSFDNLPKYENQGQPIVYTITEDAVPGYSSRIKGYDVTNYRKPQTPAKPDEPVQVKTSVQVTKAWKDGSNADGSRPNSVTVKLLANGLDTGKKLTLTAANHWTGTFEDLDQYKGDQVIRYTVEEVGGGDYTVVISGSAASGFVVTNIKEIKTVDVSGSKTWDDADNKAGKRPISITIRLLANGVEKESRKVTAANKWSWNFEDLPKYDNKGKEITYTITEDQVHGYTSKVDGYNVTNCYEESKSTKPAPSSKDEPTKPTPAPKDKPTKPASPKTGDEFNLIFYASLLVLSLVLFVVVKRKTSLK